MGFAAWLYSANLIMPWWLMLPLNLVVFTYSLARILFGVVWEGVTFIAGGFQPDSQGFLRQYIVNRWKTI